MDYTKKCSMLIFFIVLLISYYQIKIILKEEVKFSTLRSRIDSLDKKINNFSEYMGARIIFDKEISILVNYFSKDSYVDKEIIKNIVVYSIVNSENKLLLLSIIKHESKFDPEAISHKNAVGLGQVHPINFNYLKELNVIKHSKDLFQIENNITATDLILTNFIKESTTIRDALKGYSGFKDYRYSDKVLETYNEISKLVNLDRIMMNFDIMKSKQFYNTPL